MIAHAIIAARGGAAAKSRLSSALAPRERELLVTAMLGDVLSALTAASSIVGVWVVTPSDALAALAEATGARVVRDPEDGTLNGAFEMARMAVARSHPGATVVFLPGDLPLLTGADVDAVVAARPNGGIAIAPAEADGGTGALALAAVGPMRCAFGRSSFARHQAMAGTLGLRIRSVAAPGCSFDVDRPADLDILRELGAAGRTAQVLRDWAAYA